MVAAAKVEAHLSAITGARSIWFYAKHSRHAEESAAGRETTRVVHLHRDDHSRPTPETPRCDRVC